MTPEKDWDAGWQDRLLASIARAGFRSATALADSSPTTSFGQLLRGLDVRYAPIQFTAALLREAQTPEELTRFSRRMLAEYFRVRMPNGWRSGPNFEFERNDVFARWATDFAKAAGQDRIDAILHALVQLEPPMGWLPVGPDDPLIVRAFGDYVLKET